MKLSTTHDKYWMALQVKPRNEIAVSTILSNKGYEAFTPLYWMNVQWSDRIQRLQKPLFPGYVFCQYTASAGILIVTTPGVIRILRYGHDPAPIAPTEIESIRTAADSGLPVEPHPYLAIGEKVKITDGALTGLQGFLVSYKNHKRLLLSVNMIQRSVAVEIDEHCVRAISC